MRLLNEKIAKTIDAAFCRMSRTRHGSQARVSSTGLKHGSQAGPQRDGPTPGMPHLALPRAVRVPLLTTTARSFPCQRLLNVGAYDKAFVLRLLFQIP
jgi:hypothetical protein